MAVLQGECSTASVQWNPKRTPSEGVAGCLVVTGDIKNGAAVVVGDCSHPESDWTYCRHQEGSYFNLEKQAKDGKRMCLSAGRTARNGGLVQIWDCDTSATGKWKNPAWDSIGQGPSPGQCIDVKKGDTANILQTLACNKDLQATQNP